MAKCLCVATQSKERLWDSSSRYKELGLSKRSQLDVCEVSWVK